MGQCERGGRVLLFGSSVPPNDRKFSPWGCMVSWFQQSAYRVVFSVLLVSRAQGVIASESVQLDPNATSDAPLSILRAVVAEQQTERFCRVQLFPDGVLVTVRPCVLGLRLEHARRWRRDGRTIVFLDASDGRRFRFVQVSPHLYETVDAAPPQLNLSLLPAAATAPMSE